MFGHDAVTEFHKKHGFPVNRDLLTEKAPNGGSHATAKLLDMQAQLVAMSRNVQRYAVECNLNGEERLYRAHLLIEELGEILGALAHRDVVALADGTADLRYVTWGTDVAYGIPSDAVDTEVHRSNMTKSVRCTTSDPRMRDKGKDYQPPDIAGAMERGRQSKDWSARLKDINSQ